MRRMGRKKIPVFSIIATDSRNARDGRYIEDLGRYYPLKQPATVQIYDEERVLYWLENGAQPSDTVRSLISKRGLMLRHHLKKKGKSPEQIAEAVKEHIQRLEEKGEDIKMTAEMRRAQAIEEERQRAAELEEQRRKEEEERRKAEEEAKAKAEAEAKAAEEQAAAEAEEDTDEADAEAATDADAAEATDEDADDESDDTPKSDA